MTKKWTRKHYISLVAIGLAVLFIYFLGYVGKVRPLTAELQSTTEQATLYEKQLSEIIELTDQNQALSEIHDTVPPNKALDQLLMTLNDIAKQSNVAIYVMEAQEEAEQIEEAQSILKEELFNLEINATTMASMLQFLRALETSKPLILIKEMETMVSADDVTTNLIFSTYYQHE